MKSVDKQIDKIIDFEKEVELNKDTKIVMFADLVNSTYYKATNSTTDGLKRTFLHNKICTNSITKYGGTVVKYIGDEVMATFDEAEAAIEAAKDIMRQFDDLVLSEPILSKIGLHMGPINYFNYQNATTSDPQGSTVDLAARVIGCSQPCQILVTHDVLSRVKGEVKTVSEVDIIPKGFKDPIKIYSLSFNNCCIEIIQPPYISFLSPSTKKFLGDALQLLEQKKLKESVSLAVRVLEEDPRNTEACYIIGFATAEGVLSDLRKGIECLKQVLNNSPKHYRAMHLLSFLLWLKFEESEDKNSNLIDEMISYSKKCLDLVKQVEDRHTEVFVKTNLAYYFTLKNDPSLLEDAKKYCEEAEIYLNNLAFKKRSSILDTFGVVLMKIGNYEEARKKLLESEQLDPNNEYPRIHHGELLKIMKKLKLI